WPPPGSTYDSLVVAAFRANGIEPPRAAIYTHAINMRISLAATGPFLAVVTAGVISVPGKYPSIRKLPVDLPTTLRGFYVLTLKKRTLNPLAQRFIDCARHIPKSLAKRKYLSADAAVMSLMGQSHRIGRSRRSWRVRYASNSDPIGASQQNVALCHKRP